MSPKMEKTPTGMAKALSEQEDVQLESLRQLVEKLNVAYTHKDSAEEESKARSNAITLIRARTFTRFSQSGSCSPVTSSERDSVPGNSPIAVSPGIDLTFSETDGRLSARQRSNKKKNQKKKDKKKKASEAEKESAVSSGIKDKEMLLESSSGSFFPTFQDQYVPKSASVKDGKPVSAAEVVPSDKLPTRQEAPETTSDEEGTNSSDYLIAYSHLASLMTEDRFPVLRATPQRENQPLPEPSKKPKNPEKYYKRPHFADVSSNSLDNQAISVDSHSSNKRTESKSTLTPSIGKGVSSFQKPPQEPHPGEQNQLGHFVQATGKLSPIDEIDEPSKDDGQNDTSGGQYRPQNTSASETPRTKLKGKGSLSSGVVGSHAHSTWSQRTSQPTTSEQNYSSKYRRRGFFWQLDSSGFSCAKVDCDKRCNLWDCVTQICPRCGPYSEIRYCSKVHLYVDIKQHWAFCRQKTFRHPCRQNSIPRSVRDGPPLVPSRHNWDTPERHRQAVYHATSTTSSTGDYFIFADWEDYIAAGRPTNTVTVRCSTRLVSAVRFDDPSEKDRFRRILGVCLFASVEAFNLVEFMYRLIRDNLRAHGAWSFELDNALRYQIQHELSVTIDSRIVGHRHACETEWDGRNPRHCRDFICCTEYRPFMNDYGTRRGYRQFCDFMESSHWILRAARITHPVVTDVAARTRGEGFEDVLEDDKRHFRRGEGWDGAGSGEMEIEGPRFLASSFL